MKGRLDLAEPEKLGRIGTSISDLSRFFLQPLIDVCIVSQRSADACPLVQVSVGSPPLISNPSHNKTQKSQNENRG